MRIEQHILVIIAHGITVGFFAIKCLRKEHFTKACPALVEPHILGSSAGHQVTPPMMREFMRHKCFVIRGAIEKRLGIGDTCGVFHGTGIERHCAESNFRPAISTKASFKNLHRFIQVCKAQLHVGGIPRQSREPHGDFFTGNALIRYCGMGIAGHRNSRQISGDFLCQLPMREQGIFTDSLYACSHAIAIGLFGTACKNMKIVGTAFHKIIEAREPYPSKVVWNGIKADAQVVGVT